jgi:N-acetylmuramidase-like protein
MEDRFTLSPSALDRAAADLGCSLPALQAVVDVESAGRGFLSDGSAKVLFEGHVFYKYTHGRYADTHPSLCYRKWTKEHYARGATADERGAGELERLAHAIDLNRPAAMMSASYGMFQLMGFNFALCGYTHVGSFYDAMCRSAEEQLDAFIEYIEHTGLADELRDRRWGDFARRYNGPAFSQNRYDDDDEKLALAYDHHVRAASGG